MPQLLSEWDFEKNSSLGLDSRILSVGSNKKAWWKCKKEHSWEAVINSRKDGRGCPYCSGNKVFIGFNDLASINPLLAEEWHQTKNEKIRPQDVTDGSNIKVWWQCKKGHEWKASVKSRKKGNGCPYCSGHTVLPGFNDLLTVNPKLASQWHPTKNGDVFPTNVTANSSKKFWWLCENGHEWSATIANRNKGTGCPICSNKKVLAGYNDLATINPQLASEWHPTKNKTLTPKDVTAFSNKKVWWLCPMGHEWEASISHRSNGRRCPKCSEESKTSFPEQAIFHYFSQVTTSYNRFHINSRLEIDIFLPEYRIGIEYDGLYYHKSEAALQREKRKSFLLDNLGIMLIRVKESDGVFETDRQHHIIYCKSNPSDNELNDTIRRLFSYICQMFHIELRVNIDISRDRYLIYEQYIKSKKETSLSVINPTLATEWHSTKNNGLLPEHVSIRSNKKVWWKCAQGHEWEATVNSRSYGNGCPVCSGKQILIGFNDLATINPLLAMQWHPQKNDVLTPADVSVGSSRKVWWICEKGHEWKASISHRSFGSRCPVCASKEVVKGFNDLKTKNPELAKQWHPTKNKGLMPTDVTENSGRKVWWQCSKGHEWESVIAYRTNGNECPICSGRKVLVGYNDLASVNPTLASQWHFIKNVGIKPTGFTANSKRKVWWLCEKGHEWEATIGDRNKGQNCPFCANKKILVGYNDLATLNPLLAKEWHPVKNGNLLPKDVSVGSKRKVWWKCPKCLHEWEAVIHTRSNGHGCPECAKKAKISRKSE